MLSSLAKCLLVATSLCPVLGAIAVDEVGRGEQWTSWAPWLLAAVLLVGLCWLLLRYAASNAQEHALYIRDFERKDQEMITFLFIYLLPFARGAGTTFAGEWLTISYVAIVIVVAIAHVGALHFNPAMYLLGYRFYSVRNGDGVSNLLISRTPLRRPQQEIQTVRLAWNIYLKIGNSNA